MNAILTILDFSFDVVMFIIFSGILVVGMVIALPILYFVRFTACPAEDKLHIPFELVALLDIVAYSLIICYIIEVIW